MFPNTTSEVIPSSPANIFFNKYLVHFRALVNSTSHLEQNSLSHQFISSSSWTVSLKSSTTASTSALVVPLPTLTLSAFAATSVGTPQLRRMWEGLRDKKPLKLQTSTLEGKAQREILAPVSTCWVAGGTNAGQKSPAGGQHPPAWSRKRQESFTGSAVHKKLCEGHELSDKHRCGLEEVLNRAGHGITL